MIISAIVKTFASLLAFFMSFLPYGSGLPAEVLNSFKYLISQALSWDYFVPVATGFYLLWIMLGLYFAVYIWSAIRFIYSAIRGSRI